MLFWQNFLLSLELVLKWWTGDPHPNLLKKKFLVKIYVCDSSNTQYSDVDWFFTYVDVCMDLIKSFTIYYIDDFFVATENQRYRNDVWRSKCDSKEVLVS